ncbi:hypothetical protein GIB67_002122 [Kingdonia uniflora]|uniref:Exonuclease V n=1 Tax=Kingdonia uniflora TaxID=39325 RepID=A0A7J7KWI3_9MAGN|nr:hypothetical protein GIB67_002122 [Kingdonia uniflora]
MSDDRVSREIDDVISSSITFSSSIPIEIVSEEEMAIIEAAFAATKSVFSPSFYHQFGSNVRSIESSFTLISKRSLSLCSSTSLSSSELTVNSGDIEDLGGTQMNKKKGKYLETFLHRFRRKRGLAVTDITASEWCEKQMEFILLRGKPKATKEMKVGKERHAKLEEEVVQRIKVDVKEIEDAWAVKFMNFIIGSNQLLFEGLTRELPIVGFIDGVWMVGVIDELRMPITKTVRNPLLVDTKTRSQPTLPSEPQKRNGRLQLMCYKYLWDSVVTSNFPLTRFYNFFGLNPQYILSQEVQDLCNCSGLPAKTLEDMVMYFRNTCCTLPPTDNQLILRYEFQGDNSLIGEERFTYDFDWLTSQIKSSLEFWMGEREANYVPPEERWKCRFCKFSLICPTNATVENTISSSAPL